MSSHNVKKPDDLVTCPYNEAHRIRYARFPGHLIKCRKAHPNSNMKICPFTALHHIPDYKYQDHIAECPDRDCLDRIVIAESEEPFTNTVVPPYETKEVSQPTEDWDAECSQGVAYGYDPSEQAKRTTYFNPSVLSGMTRSEKRGIRKAHHISEGSVNEDARSTSSADASDAAPSIVCVGARLQKEKAKSLCKNGDWMSPTSNPEIAAGLTAHEDTMVEQVVEPKQQTKRPDPVEECASRFENLRMISIGRSRGRARPLPLSSVQEVGQMRQTSSSAQN